MDLKEVSLLGRGQDRHWYYVAKSAALLRCVHGRAPRQILDIGAGSGFFAEQLLHKTTAQSAVCIDPAYAGDSSKTIDGKPLVFKRTAQADAADLVLLMDVLEHVDDDVGLLAEQVALARPGTRFVVSVPAFSWLWSAHDTFLEHRRRYTLNQLQSVVVRAGLTPTSGFYFFATVFPAAAALRLLQHLGPRADVSTSDLREHHPWINALLRRLCLAEARVAHLNRAFGLTAFVVAEKRPVPEQGPS